MDFADVRMVMNNSGMALMGSGTASGENRAIRAVEEAFMSPLLNDFDLTTAKSVLVNITSSKDHGLTMAELSQIMDYIKEFTGNNPENFKRGVVCDPSIEDAISVTVVATGFDMNSLPQISSSGGKLVESVVLGSETIGAQITTSSYIDEIVSISKELPVNRQTAPVKKEQDMAPAIKKSKPTLIIESGDNISELESQPAYIRKQMRVNQGGGNTGRTTDSRESSTFKLEEIDGKQHLFSDNSYIHQTQD